MTWPNNIVKTMVRIEGKLTHFGFLTSLCAEGWAWSSRVKILMLLRQLMYLTHITGAPGI